MAFPVINGTTVLMKPPEGYVVDFENPQSQSTMEHYLVFGTLGPLALICLIQRIYTKLVFSDGLKIDDGEAEPLTPRNNERKRKLTVACSITMQSLQTWSIAMGGLGHHTWEMSIETYQKQALISYIVAAVFICANGATKASLFFAYLKISPLPWYRRFIIAGIVMVSTYTIVIASMLLFGCQPIRANWDPYVAADSRLNSAMLYMAIATSNILSDVVLFLIPIPMILRLQMRPVVKVGAMVMFGVGTLTVTTSVVRMVYLQPLLRTQDVSWVAAPANVWSFVEVNLFIICGSMPTLRRFFRAIAPKWVGQSSHNSQSKPTQSGSRKAYSQFDVEMDSLSSQQVILPDDKSIVRHTTFEVKSLKA
ncbi:hypothetical protein CMUS01_04261 [Colletotrichum musicola]|uniref:Rhodopsin domain-containing protein n=1 Tax=Colletotrichum musicola TaxID=2175873 RepID=A0A8H6KYA4_9PEZI|nr:hypothetical protein CMUS01_04261 [Colletotrichum musicola]